VSSRPDFLADFEAGLRSKRELVDRALENLLADGEVPNGLAQALRQALFPGGKRLRPICVLATAELLGRDPERALDLAAACELVHSASLVLDDLPSMDDATMRRGHPALHLQFGEATAILAAIALLARAFESVAETGRRLRLPRETTAALAAERAQAVGAQGMAAGQYLDLTATLTPGDLTTIEFIHSRKTGKLFVAAFRISALALRADELTLEALTGFGRNLGLAFQVTDDILAVTASSAELGKHSVRDDRLRSTMAPGGREAAGREAGAEGSPASCVNFATLFGLEQAHVIARELVAAAVHCLALFGERAEFLRALARYVLARRT